MNLFRRLTVFVHRWALELLLLLAGLSLVIQILWPTARYWWRLPGAGQAGFDRFSAATLADEFLIRLPPDYHKQPNWPLVLFLHGKGQRGNDPKILQQQQVFRRQLPAIVVAPQCLTSASWEPTAVAELVRYLISRYHVDAKRIYLVGFSMGGYGTWATAVAHPDMFAAIVPIAGGGDPNHAKSLTAVSIWAFHGENDNVAPASETARMVEAIRAAHGQPKATILPDEGHGICEKVCGREDLWQWLFVQHRAASQ